MHAAWRLVGIVRRFLVDVLGMLGMVFFAGSVRGATLSEGNGVGAFHILHRCRQHGLPSLFLDEQDMAE